MVFNEIYDRLYALQKENSEVLEKATKVDEGFVDLSNRLKELERIWNEKQQQEEEKEAFDMLQNERTDLTRLENDHLMESENNHNENTRSESNDNYNNTSSQSPSRRRNRGSTRPNSTLQEKDHKNRRPASTTSSSIGTTSRSLTLKKKMSTPTNFNHNSNTNNENKQRNLNKKDDDLSLRLVAKLDEQKRDQEFLEWGEELEEKSIIDEQAKIMRQIELEKEEADRKKQEEERINAQKLAKKKQKKEKKRKDAERRKREAEAEEKAQEAEEERLREAGLQARLEAKLAKKQIRLEEEKKQKVLSGRNRHDEASEHTVVIKTKVGELEQAELIKNNKATKTSNEFEEMRLQLAKQTRNRESSKVVKQRLTTVDRKKGGISSYLYPSPRAPSKEVSPIFAFLANKNSVNFGQKFLRQEQDLIELKKEERQLQQEVHTFQRLMAERTEELNSLNPNYVKKLEQLEKKEIFLNDNITLAENSLKRFVPSYKTLVELYQNKPHLSESERKSFEAIKETIAVRDENKRKLKEIPLEYANAKTFMRNEVKRINDEIQEIKLKLVQKEAPKANVSHEVYQKSVHISHMAQINPFMQLQPEHSFEFSVSIKLDNMQKERDNLNARKDAVEQKLNKHRLGLTREIDKLESEMQKIKEKNKGLKNNEDLQKKKKELGLGDEPVDSLSKGIHNLLNGGSVKGNVKKYLETKYWKDTLLNEIVETGKALNELKMMLKLKPVKGGQFNINSMRDQNDLSFLMAAVQNEDQETAKLCLDLGAFPDEMNSSGQTALFFSRYFNLDKLIALLIDHGASKIGTNSYWGPILNKPVPTLHEIDWSTQLRIAEKAAISTETQIMSSDDAEADPNWRMEKLSEDEQKVAYFCFDAILTNPTETTFQRTVLLEKGVCEWLLKSNKNERMLLRKWLNCLKPENIRKKEAGSVSCHRRALVGTKDIFEVMCARIILDDHERIKRDDTVILFSPFVESQIDGSSNAGVLIWAVTTDGRASYIKALIEEAEFKRNKIDYPNDRFVDHRDFVLRLGKDMHLVDLHTTSIYDGGMMELFTLNVDDGDLKKLMADNFIPQKRIRDHEKRTRGMLFLSSEEDEVQMNQEVLADVQGSMSTNLFGGAGTGKTHLMVEKITHTDIENKLLVVSRLPRLVSAIRTRVEESRDPSNVTCITYNDLMSHLLRCIVVDDENDQINFSTFSQVHFCETTSTGGSGSNSFERDFFYTFLDDGERKEMKALNLEPIRLWGSFRIIKSDTQCSLFKRHLTRDEFLALPKSFGLKQKQRDLAFNMYLRYEEWLRHDNFKWDEADRVLYILRFAGNVFAESRFVSWHERTYQLGEEGLVGADNMPLAPFFFHMVFIDEAQDLSDCDLALLLRMSSGIRSLFIGADPAQSVEIGLKMRISTVNNVFHSCLPDHQHNTLQVKNVLQEIQMKDNHRTHAQNLKLAKAIRQMLARTFGIRMSEEEAILNGPIPKAMMLDSLGNLTDKGIFQGGNTVFIAPDEIVSNLRCVLLRLGVKNDVFGVREAKGLEFKSVALINFFSHFENLGNKYEWKQWILGNETPDYVFTHPELEDHAMLLYTAITRARNHLYFIESKDSLLQEKGSPLAEFVFRQFKKLKLLNIVYVIDEGTAEMTAQEHKARGVLLVTQAIALERNKATLDSIKEKFMNAASRFEQDKGNDEHLLQQCNRHLEAIIQKRSLTSTLKSKFFDMKKGQSNVKGKFSEILKFEADASNFVDLCGKDSFLVDEIHDVRLLIEDVFFGTLYQEHFENICNKMQEYGR